jgi:hypothetical protein
MCCIFKRKRQRGFNVTAALWPNSGCTTASTSATKHLTQDVAKTISTIEVKSATAWAKAG